MVRRIIGGVLLATGVLGLVLSIAGVVFGGQLVDVIGASLQDTLALASDGLDTTRYTLTQTKTTMAEANKGLDNARKAAVNAGQSLDDLDPLLEQTGQIIAEDVPNSLDSTQEAIPQLAEVAKTVDETLKTLSDFKIAQDFLGATFEFDLGIDYNSDQPLDEPILQIGDSIGDVSSEFRELTPELEKTSANLQIISGDVTAIAQDLEAINKSIAEFSPLLDRYINLVDDVQTGITQTQNTMDGQLKMVKLLIVILMIWLALAQIAPLYLGWELVAERRETDYSGQQVPASSPADNASNDS